MKTGEIRISGKMHVTRIWEVKNIDTGKFYNYHMILMDRTINQIECMVTPNQFNMHMEKLREQNVISLKKFPIANYSRTYRPLPSNLWLTFNTFINVKVETEDNKNIPTFRFFLTELEELLERYGDIAHTIGYTVVFN
ncbi:hypothetical protein MKX01_014833 [Papaver californicum]|nr:hypothetical protein MKX01_014833 [Papaver californicum]